MKFTSDIVIGLEIHAELATDSKLFCGCATSGDDEPNSRTCEVCLGMPGSKPVLNKKAVNFALKLCLALGCKVSPELIFSRKSYFYPDMAKNYQISQYEIPLGTGGKLKLASGKEIGITKKTRPPRYRELTRNLRNRREDKRIKKATRQIIRDFNQRLGHE